MRLIDNEAGLESINPPAGDSGIFDHLLTAEPRLPLEALVKYLKIANKFEIDKAKNHTAGLGKRGAFFEKLAETTGVKIIIEDSYFGDLLVVESAPGLAEAKLGLKHKKQLDDILGNLRQTLEKEGNGQTSKKLEGQIWQLLDNHLPKNERYPTEKEVNQLKPLVFNTEWLLSSPQQTQLLGQLFDQAPPALKDAFAALKSALAESHEGSPDLNPARTRFTQELEEACGNSHLKDSLQMENDLFDQTRRTAQLLLKLPAVEKIGADDFVQTAAIAVYQYREILRIQKELQERQNKFIAGLADKAGLKLIQFEKKGTFRTEKTKDLILAKK